MYYELTIDPFYKHGIFEPEGLPWDLNLISGGVITEQVEKPFPFVTKAEAGDDLPDFWDAGAPAMSKRFVELLEGAGVDNLQTFPAIVESKTDGTVWEGFYLVNILGRIKCADFGRSVYSELFPGSFEFEELAIDAEKAKGALLFRLQESPDVILMHKSVGKYIRQNDQDRTLKGWDVRRVIQ